MDYKQANDYEIMYMISESDDEARSIIFKKYTPIIKSLASKYLFSVKNKGIDFDDLFQEGIIALNKAISTYSEENGVLFYTYASVCIERHLITFCKRTDNKKNYALNNSYFDDEYYSVKDPTSFVDKFIDESIVEEEFLFCKNMFDIKFSSVFELRYNGFTYKEISKLLDLPISTIDGRIYKMRKTLQEKYNFNL